MQGSCVGVRLGRPWCHHLARRPPVAEEDFELGIYVELLNSRANLRKGAVTMRLGCVIMARELAEWRSETLAKIAASLEPAKTVH